MITYEDQIDVRGISPIAAAALTSMPAAYCESQSVIRRR